MTLDPDFVAILTCPACDDRPPLRLSEDTLICDVCSRSYMIRDGIPVLLPDEAILPADDAAAASPQTSDPLDPSSR